MDEAEICDKVAVIDHGEIIAHDTPFELKKQYTKDRAYITTINPAMLEKLLDEKNINYVIKEKYHRIDVENNAELLHVLSECKNDITDIEIRKGTLNDVFLEITGREIREGGNSQ
jgi:ABC-2 type transport system ATP-binding protein